MDKKYIVIFLKERKRGVYTLIVNMYVDVVTNMPVTMALQVIKDDLQKETGDSVELNYFSLAKAVSKLENRISRKSTTVVTRKWEFKDANELKERELPPGKFNLVKPS